VVLNYSFKKGSVNMANNQKIVVRRNTDDSVVQRLFGNQMTAAAQSSHLVGSDMFKDEPWDYIPPPGVSTRRGSRMVNSMDGSPFGSPSEIVEREIRRNPEIRKADLKDIHPLAITQVKPSNIIDKIGDHGPSMPPPKQSDSIPEEYREMMKKYPMPETEPVEEPPAPKGGPTMISHVNYPRQFVTEDIPSGAKPDMKPPIAPGHILPPTQPDKPHKITEDMIVKVAGYNETNMYLLTEVSKNVAYCGKVIAELNNAAKPVNMNEVMSLLAWMDNEEFRKSLVGMFQTVLKNNMELSGLITKYLNGELPAPDEEPTPETPDETNSEAQDQPGQSASNDDNGNSGDIDSNISEVPVNDEVNPSNNG
jgi:hypothetical protein